MTNKEWKEYLIEELDNLIKRVKKAKSFKELNKLSCDHIGNGGTAYEYVYGHGDSYLQVFFDEEEGKYGVITKWTGNSDYGGFDSYLNYYGESLKLVKTYIIHHLEYCYEDIEDYFKKPYWMIEDEENGLYDDEDDEDEEEEGDEYKESKD